MNANVLFSTLIAAVILSSCNNKKEEKVQESEFIVTNPIVKDTTFTKEYVAQIQSIENVEIRALEKGYLEALHIDEGRLVKSGQLLFSIMPKVYQAEYMKEKADTRLAELELQNVKTLADRSEERRVGKEC